MIKSMGHSDNVSGSLAKALQNLNNAFLTVTELYQLHDLFWFQEYHA